MKYFILIKNNKIINAGLDYKTPFIKDTYDNINEDKTYINTHIGGEHEILYLYTE